jgi:hypothetical protein
MLKIYAHIIYLVDVTGNKERECENQKSLQGIP